MFGHYVWAILHVVKITPIKVLYDRPPPTISRVMLDGTCNHIVAESLHQTNRTFNIPKVDLHQALLCMNVIDDKGWKDVSFVVGDWFFPYTFIANFHSVCSNNNLSRRFFGPFQIVQNWISCVQTQSFKYVLIFTYLFIVNTLEKLNNGLTPSIWLVHLLLLNLFLRKSCNMTLLPSIDISYINILSNGKACRSIM